MILYLLNKTRLENMKDMWEECRKFRQIWRETNDHLGIRVSSSPTTSPPPASISAAARGSPHQHPSHTTLPFFYNDSANTMWQSKDCKSISAIEGSQHDVGEMHFATSGLRILISNPWIAGSDSRSRFRFERNKNYKFRLEKTRNY